MTYDPQTIRQARGKKGFVNILLAIVVLVLLSGGGYYLYSTQKGLRSLKVGEQEQQQKQEEKTEEVDNKPTVLILSPASGEKLKPGTEYTIRWELKNMGKLPNLPESLAHPETWLITGVVYPEFRGDFQIFSLSLSGKPKLFNWKVIEFSHYPRGETYQLEICIQENPQRGGIEAILQGYCSRSESFLIEP